MITRAEMEQLFDDIDTEGNGSINRSQFFKIIRFDFKGKNSQDSGLQNKSTDSSWRIESPLKMGQDFKLRRHTV